MCPYLDEKTLSHFCEQKFSNIMVFIRIEWSLCSFHFMSLLTRFFLCIDVGVEL